MFRACDFTFAGESASMYGLSLYDIGNKKHSDNAFGNRANIVEKRIAGRYTPIHYGVRYEDTPLSFSLIFGGDKPLDRFDMQAITKWLTGHKEYQWLSIDEPDMMNVQYRCLIRSITPISVGWIAHAFEAEVICDSPYGYSVPFEKEYSTNGNSTAFFYNDSTANVDMKPVIELDISSGCSEFSIRNKTNNKEMIFSGIPNGGAALLIDCENCIVTDKNGERNYYDWFNFVFLSFQPGENELEIKGKGSFIIRGRYIYNTGA